MYVPIREIKNEMGRNRFFVFSKRLNREVRLYNDLQYDHWCLVESNPLIIKYCEKPLRIVETVAGEVIESIFDMWIQNVEGTEEYICVRHSYEVDLEHKRSKSLAIKELYAQRIWCAKNNKIHRLITEKEIRVNTVYLANIKTLLPYFTPLCQLDLTLNQLLLELVTESKYSIRQLENLISNNYEITLIRKHIYNLIHHGILEADICNCLISGLTEVSISVSKEISREFTD
ncbi:hypothetical protein ABN764_04510 [Paenibacillaceae sp. P-4]|uniref:hypothetical protein n=1 Tax=Paenibacillaceae bacterium P-4 TaxID=3160969 RepID=UPI0032E84D29